MSGSITCIGIVVGMVLGFIGAWDAKHKSDLAHEYVQLASLAYLNRIFEDDAEIRERLAAFERTFDSQKISTVLAASSSGEDAYLSERLADLRAVGRHYEQLGALVRLGYLDFRLVYEVIPFPETFWETTEEMRVELRNCNWSNHRGLPDFWRNFEYLRERYAVVEASEHPRPRPQTGPLTHVASRQIGNTGGSSNK